MRRRDRQQAEDRPRLPSPGEPMWAYVAAGPDGVEGIIGMTTDQGWVPFVGTDQARIESLHEHALAWARMNGKTVRLLRWNGPPTQVDLLS